MKKYLFGAVAALAMAPGLAAADTNGAVSFSYNSIDDDDDGAKDDYIALGGSVATSLSGNWNLQFDAEAGDMSHTSHTDSFVTTSVQAFTRNDSYAFGGFAGLTSNEITGYFVGADAALYMGRFTLAGAALIGGNREDSNDSIESVGAAGTFFVSDNFSVGVDANWFEFDFGGGGNSQDGSVYGINAEYQFAGSAFSVFGGYHGSDFDNFGSDNEVNSGTIGIRYNFGTGSLIERDRNGASMLGASQLSRTQVFAY